MNILVYIKQTFDTEAKIVLDGSGKIDSKGVNLIVNPFDEYAIEEGIRLKEKFGGEVTAITLGGADAQAALRTALAMGADKAVLVSDPSLENADEWTRAEALAKAVAKIPYDIILTGRIEIDDGSAQIGVRLAESLNIPSVSSILKLDIDGTQATITREIDGGTEVVEVSLPIVVTCQKGLNEPRYPSVAGIMKAKKKPLTTMAFADIGFTAGDKKMNIDKYSLPSARQAGKIIPGEPADAAKELARLLREEAKVL
ncbi:MAG: electron transfer flavoprotein subunit beta/FixA family protein [Desulfosporosinus sp.]|jgi:electron transfer flavoprotein beta subunit